MNGNEEIQLKEQIELILQTVMKLKLNSIEHDNEIKQKGIQRIEKSQRKRMIEIVNRNVFSTGIIEGITPIQPRQHIKIIIFDIEKNAIVICLFILRKYLFTVIPLISQLSEISPMETEIEIETKQRILTEIITFTRQMKENIEGCNLVWLYFDSERTEGKEIVRNIEKLIGMTNEHEQFPLLLTIVSEIQKLIQYFEMINVKSLNVQHIRNHVRMLVNELKYFD